MAIESTTGTMNSVRPARPISAVTVAIAPGPASSGMASGKMATSSFSAPSCSSSGMMRVRTCCARSISMEVSRSRMPPATLKAPSVTPSSRKMTVPAMAKMVRMTNAVSAARRAMRRRFSSESPCVMATKMGSAPIGSTTKNTAERESRLNESSSRTHECMVNGLYHAALQSPGRCHTISRRDGRCRR